MGNNIDRPVAYELLSEALSELIFGGNFSDELTSRLSVISKLDSVLQFLEEDKV